MSEEQASQSRLAAVILAGGGSRRMGGTDKGLVTLNGRPMIAYVVDALRPQVDTLFISANRNREAYARFGCPVIADEPTHAGPLAGVAAALQQCDCERLLSVPCDAPLIPAGLVARLCEALDREHTDVGVAADAQRLQPAFAVIRRRLLPALRRYLDAGDRKVESFYAAQAMSRVDCTDWPLAFVNVNTPEQRAEAEKLLSADSRYTG